MLLKIWLFNSIYYPILVFGILSVAFSIYKLIKIKKSNTPGRIGLLGVWLSGILSVLIGVWCAINYRVEAFKAIAEMQNINPEIVANSMIVISRHLLIGTSLLIISLVSWGLLKGLKNQRIASLEDRKNEL